MYFYEILQTIMQEKNLKIPDVARLSDLPDSTIRSIISRKNKTVALEVAFKLSKGLNVSLEELNGEYPNSSAILLNTEDEFKKAAASLSDDDFVRNLIIEYWKLDDDSKKLFRSFIRKLASGIKEESMTLEKTPDIYKTSSKEKITEKSEVLQKNSSIPATVEKEKTVKELEEEYKKIHLKTASKKESTVLNITDGKESKDKKFHIETEQVN